MASVAEDLPTEGIEPQTRDLADRGPGVRAPAVESPQPQDEFPQLERFGEVVVGDVGGDRLQPQTVTDGFSQVGLVLHDQYAHL